MRKIIKRLSFSFHLLCRFSASFFSGFSLYEQMICLYFPGISLKKREI